MRHHGDAQRSGDGWMLKDFTGQAGGFGAEEENVASLVGDIYEVVFRVAGKCEDAFSGHFLAEGVKVGVDLEISKIVVVQSCTLEMGVGEIESEGLDEMERGACTSGEADGSASVAGNARLKENNMEHAHMLLVGAREMRGEKWHVGVCDGVVSC